MLRSFNSFVILLISLGYTSCSNGYVTDNELREYILDESNGLRKCTISNDYLICTTYRPTDLLISQELGNDSDSTTIKRLRNKYSNHHYFILSLSKQGHEAVSASKMPPHQFGELIQTISFRMGDYLSMTTDRQDTLLLADFLYNRTFDMGKSTDILLVFEKEKTKGNKWIQINLEEFGLGVGQQYTSFSIEDLENSPKIFRH